MGALVFCGTGKHTRVMDAKVMRPLWDEAGEVLARHPELLESATSVRGFGGGARWMHQAMRIVGWSLPPFADETAHTIRGLAKYLTCILAAAVGVGACLGSGFWWVAPLLGGFLFYMVEAQMVFLFPVVLAGSRSPWCRSYALTLAAGGTWQVMRTVMPIAFRMMTGFVRPDGSVGTWCRGCLSIVIWHRRVCESKRGWVDSEQSLPRLEIGPVHQLLLRHESIQRGLQGRFRVLWISDLHWRGAGDAGTLLSILKIARHSRPDVFVLGGDFLDNANAADLFRRLVRRLAGIAPCVVLPGNHEAWKAGSLVRSIVGKSGGIWLPDHPEFSIHHSSGERLGIVGDIGLLEGSSAEVRLLCVHNPAKIGRFPDLPKHTIGLAGHLHGGQWVLWQKGGHLFPAAWVYPHNCLRKKLGGSDLIVCRGAGDTLPLRWNCPREVVLCDIS